jgi:tRNA-Thr(GGU) m(6)t(6)A37 methyltransferase TsaA
MQLKVIAYARNGHTDKFGIPRQSREESPILTRIVFEPEYNVQEALRGIEGYSHLWILWGFSEVQSIKEVQGDKVQSTKDWSPTVRPPRLGGNKRMGVFATRSPFRPNPIGLSSVKLIEVRRDQVPSTKDGRMELIVSGADVLDGTPIYDIKPYLSFSDCHPEAKNGFAEETKDYGLEVRFSEDLTAQNLDKTSIKLLRDIEYILSQDPRPAYQDDPEREYKMDYAGYRVTFCVKTGVAEVLKIEKIAAL